MTESLGSEKCCVFAWGANSYGQLGLGHKIDSLLPSKCKVEEVVTKGLQLVTGGGGHSVLVTGDSEVYVFGWNKNGQLGVPPSEDVTVPHPLAGGLSHCATKIAKVSCGWNHTLATGNGGSLFVWGSNAFGQLGAPDILKQTDRPVVLQQQMFSDSRVLDIAAGLRHSMAVTENGSIYSWGDGKKGQLGYGGRELKVQPTPKCGFIHLGDAPPVMHEDHRTNVHASLKEHPQKWRKAGNSATTQCDQVVMATPMSKEIDGGDVFAWGLNQHGQCGVGALMDELKSGVDAECFKVSASSWIMNVFQPLSIKRLPAISEVCCGWSHVLAVTIHRQVYTWGRSDYGQLGLRDRDENLHSNQQADCCQEPREIPQLQGATQVVCGSEHSIAIGAAKEVVTFGWNEHGMCATGDEKNVLCPHTVESLRGWEPVLVGAGAGHSFVVARQQRVACATGGKCS